MTDTHPLRAFLMCTSACFIVTYYLPFLIALTAAGALSPTLAGLGLVFWSAVSTVVEALNRLSDRREDEINRPGRTHLCRVVGYERLGRIARVAMVVAVAAGVGMALVVGTSTAWIAIPITMGIGIGYSYMPAGNKPLKQSRPLSPSLNAMPTVGPFLVGAAMATVWPPGGLAQAFGVLALLYLAIVGIGGAKDVTDVPGDVAIGYRSAYLDFVDRAGRLHLAYPAVFAGATLALVALGVVPARAFAAVPAVVAAYWWVLALTRRGLSDPTGSAAMRARLVSSHLQMAVVGVIGLVAYPEVVLLAATAAVALYWVAARRWFYWAPYEMKVAAA